jgi:16S rRNA (uracil1498-N3)-methyltransferase
VGPEGGWTSAERSSGLPIVRLGAHVLRAETAAIAAGVLLTALREGIISRS